MLTAIKNLLVVALLLSLLGGQAFAKDTEALANLQNSVAACTQKVAQLRAAMEEGRIRAENAEAEVDALIAQLMNIKAHVGEGSETWEHFDVMMEFFVAQKAVAEKKMNDPQGGDQKYWEGSVKEWNGHVTTLNELKDQMILKSKEIDRKANLLGRERDKVVDTLLRGQAEMAEQILSDALAEVNKTNEGLDKVLAEFGESDTFNLKITR